MSANTAEFPTMAGERDCSYYGEREDWPIVVSQHRDSPALDRSNFRVLLTRLGGESDTVAVERLGHWAVGWVEYIMVNPSDAARLDVVRAARLELDEEDWSAQELEDHETYCDPDEPSRDCAYCED